MCSVPVQDAVHAWETELFPNFVVIPYVLCYTHASKSFSTPQERGVWEFIYLFIYLFFKEAYITNVTNTVYVFFPECSWDGLRKESW